MKAVIVLYSCHHMNTEKVARTIASILGAEIKTLQQADPNSLSGYDLVGFGSGVYFGKLGKNLMEFADKLPQVTGNKAFIFSTSGRAGKAAAKFHAPFKEKLLSKGFNVVGEFNCAGFDTFGALKLLGGINKGRPNDEDLKQAEAFAQSLKQDSSKP